MTSLRTLPPWTWRAFTCLFKVPCSLLQRPFQTASFTVDWLCFPCLFLRRWAPRRQGVRLPHLRNPPPHQEPSTNVSCHRHWNRGHTGQVAWSIPDLEPHWLRCSEVARTCTLLKRSPTIPWPAVTAPSRHLSCPNMSPDGTDVHIRAGTKDLRLGLCRICSGLFGFNV